MVFVIAFVAIGSAAFLSHVIFSDGAKGTGVWSKRQGVALGDSPYRQAESMAEVPQNAPLSLRITCWIAAMGGLATVGLLAPAGLLLVLVALDYATGVIPVLVLAVSLSGFPAGVILIRVARRVLRRQPLSDSAFAYLFTHHACVAAVMFFLQASSRANLQVFPFSFAVCSILFALVITMKQWALIPATQAPTPAREARPGAMLADVE